MLEKGAELDLFMKHIGHWTWVHLLYLYDDKHLLIADDFFLERIQQARKKPLVCKTSSVDDYAGAVTVDIKKILVFCQSNELQLVRSLQRKYPDIVVTSGTYGYACTDVSRVSQLIRFQEPSVQRCSSPVVMLSPPYSDAEFIAHSMAGNGLPYCHEYLGRPFALWLKHHRNFQTLRFFDGALQRFGAEDTLSVLLQTDVLRSVFENTNFTFRKFLLYLKKMEAKVIVVRREDKIMEVVSAQLLGRTSERSVWTNRPKKKLGTTFQFKDVDGCLQRFSDVRKDEDLINQVVASGLYCHQLKLENYVENQEKELGDIAEFLSVPLPETVSALDYWSAYERAEGIMPGVTGFKRAMIDKIGLHLR